MTRWPRRAKTLRPGLPKSLQEFVEDDWSEWLLPGPDPGTVGYVDVDAFYAGLADRPEVAAVWRRLDAHKRWTAARRTWLEAHGHPDLAFDCWLDDVAYEHRVLRAELREASG